MHTRINRSISLAACMTLLAIAGCADSRKQAAQVDQDQSMIIVKNGASFEFPPEIEFDGTIWKRDSQSSRETIDGVGITYVSGQRKSRLDFQLGAPGELMKRQFQLRCKDDAVGRWRPEGVTVVHLSDGTRVERQYTAGAPIGTLKVFYPNGNLKYRGLMHSASREGKFEGYYETGELWWSAVFAGNELVEGSAVVKSKDGEILDIEPLEVMF